MKSILMYAKKAVKSKTLLTLLFFLMLTFVASAQTQFEINDNTDFKTGITNLTTKTKTAVSYIIALIAIVYIAVKFVDILKAKKNEAGDEFRSAIIQLVMGAALFGCGFAFFKFLA